MLCLSEKTSGFFFTQTWKYIEQNRKGYDSCLSNIIQFNSHLFSQFIWFQSSFTENAFFYVTIKSDLLSGDCQSNGHIAEMHSSKIIQIMQLADIMYSFKHVKAIITCCDNDYNIWKSWQLCISKCLH